MIHLLEAVDVLVDTKEATRSWPEGTAWNGDALISRSTGHPAQHERLYRSPAGRYFIVGSSEVPDEQDYAVPLSREAATRWLDLNGHDASEALQ